MEYFIHLAILVAIYSILTQSFNLSFGLGQLFNLAHVAAYAIGAYTTALLATELELGFFSCIIASMLLSGLFSLLIGAISLYLTQDYFAVGTIAFSALVSALLVNWKSLTRGVLGIPGIPRPELFGIDFYESTHFLVLVCVAAALTQLFFYLLFRSSFARSARAQAESEHASLALAQRTRLIRNICFFISSSFAGLAGAFFAYYLNFIDPTSFTLTEMIFVLSIVVIGRPGSFYGCLLATVFLVLLPEPLRFLEIPSSVLGPTRQALYALILFAVTYWNRERLFPIRRTV